MQQVRFGILFSHEADSAAATVGEAVCTNEGKMALLHC